MALDLNVFGGSVTFRDTKGDETTISLEVDAASADGALTAVAAYAAAIAPLSDAVIVSYSAYQKVIESAYVAPVGADVWDELYLTVGIDGAANKTGNLRVPAPKLTTAPSTDLLFAGTTGEAAKNVNANNTELLAWVALHGGAGNIFISDGERASGILKGRKRQGRRRAY